MTKDDITRRIETIVQKFEGEFDAPIERLKRGEAFDRQGRTDWLFLEERFGCTFSPEFMAFVEVIVDYNLPGMLNVTRDGRTNGDPTFDWWYDREMSAGDWNADLIPFLAVGNGDFFCLSAAAGPESGVFYVDHEADTERIARSFAEWLERLEHFLNG